MSSVRHAPHAFLLRRALINACRDKYTFCYQIDRVVCARCRNSSRAPQIVLKPSLLGGQINPFAETDYKTHRRRPFFDLSVVKPAWHCWSSLPVLYRSLRGSIDMPSSKMRHRRDRGMVEYGSTSALSCMSPSIWRRLDSGCNIALLINSDVGIQLALHVSS